MTATIATPFRYADVTPEWIGQVLRQSWPEAQAASMQRGPVFGHKQNKFRVHVEYADPACGLPASFIVKGNFPGENDPSTGSAWAMATELRSFRDVAPLVTAPAGPRCHHIAIGEEASIIVMEDLALKGAQFFDAFTTLNIGQALAFMDAFAHAREQLEQRRVSAGRQHGAGQFRRREPPHHQRAVFSDVLQRRKLAVLRRIAARARIAE